MEGNIAPEVRDEIGPDQREFNHDPLGEKGTLSLRTYLSDLRDFPLTDDSGHPVLKAFLAGFQIIGGNNTVETQAAVLEAFMSAETAPLALDRFLCGRIYTELKRPGAGVR